LDVGIGLDQIKLYRRWRTFGQWLAPVLFNRLTIGRWEKR
jgi:hypothetical protein